jgi:hypothetical protein
MAPPQKRKKEEDDAGAAGGADGLAGAVEAAKRKAEARLQSVWREDTMVRALCACAVRVRCACLALTGVLGCGAYRTLKRCLSSTTEARKTHWRCWSARPSTSG